MLNELFQTKVNLMESVMKDLNTPNPLSQIELPPPTNHYTLFWLHMSVRAPSNSSSTFIPISEISLTISVDPFRTKTWIEWLEYICISIFLLVKIFLKLHIADRCCCGVNLVSPVRPLQAEICSRHEFWWWQVVVEVVVLVVVLYSTGPLRLPLHHSPSHETRLGATTD